VTTQAGTLRAVAREFIRLYGLRFAFAAPLVVAVAVGAVAGVAAPTDLADNTHYDEWKDLFGTSGQIIGTLLVALIVEVRSPFVRSGALAIRAAGASAGALLTAAGMAAVVGLSPSLPGCVYPWLIGLTLGGAAGGFTAIVLLGLSGLLGTLNRVDQEALARLKELDDPSVADDVLDRGI
jgi:hypothetical protein